MCQYWCLVNLYFNLLQKCSDLTLLFHFESNDTSLEEFTYLFSDNSSELFNLTKNQVPKQKLPSPGLSRRFKSVLISLPQHIPSVILIYLFLMISSYFIFVFVLIYCFYMFINIPWIPRTVPNKGLVALSHQYKIIKFVNEEPSNDQAVTTVLVYFVTKTESHALGNWSRMVFCSSPSSRGCAVQVKGACTCWEPSWWKVCRVSKQWNTSHAKKW